MAQYPIPQFIEAEGRIIPFLTFRQFFWLVGGGTLCLLFYYKLPFWLFVILGGIVVIIVALAAFIKVDDMYVMKFFLNYATFSIRSKNYIWKKRQVAYPFKTNNLHDSDAKLGDSKLHQVKGMVEYRKK